MSTVVLIAAVARDGAIGRGNGLLWSDPEDMKHFRAETQGCPVVMGRRTWESLPARFRPLPGRRNVVVTRQAGYAAPGAETAPGLDMALALLAEAPRICVIGGGQLYAEALARADEMVLTEVDAAYPDADTFFPRWPWGSFAEVERQARQAADGTAFAFVRYRRHRPGPTG